MRLLLLTLLPLLAFAECRYRVEALLFPDEGRAEMRVQVTEANVSLQGFNLPGIANLTHETEEAGTTLYYTIKRPDMITRDFVMLLDGWLFPVNGLCRYEAVVTLPKPFVAVTEHEHVTQETDESRNTYRFTMDRPIDRLSLIASPRFVPRTTDYHGMTLTTYFYKGDAQLSARYFEKTKAYLSMYETLLGPYPYKAFAIVENEYQTGYSMPTFTLIGDAIIAKPYLIDRSLGHEIAHQWFGNSVFNNFDKGNWVEGLVTYLSDHHLKALEGTDAVYRKQTLDGFMNAVTPDSDFSLILFHHRSDRATMSVGYGKGMFLFHMLRRELGDKIFLTALKAFYAEYAGRYADYNDITAFFDRYAAHSLKPFFFQWLYARGQLDLDVTDAVYDAAAEEVTFRVKQLGRSRPFDVPLEIALECADRKTVHTLRLNALEHLFTLPSRCAPKRLVVDENYHLFRTLDPAERLLTIGTLDRLEGFDIIGASEAERTLLHKMFKADPKGRAHHTLYANAFASMPRARRDLFTEHDGDMSLQMVPDPEHEGDILVRFDYPRGGLANALQRLKYYQAYTSIAAKGHNSLFKILAPSQNGMVVPVSEKTE